MDFPGGSGRPPPPQHQHQHQLLPPMTPLPLTRQGSSVYSLTFDEFQSAIGGPGKDFGSMNMDELLRNIWTAEESQAIGAGPNAAASSSAAAGPDHGGIQRQGSLTLPRTLSQKTVDEVWRDMMFFGGPSASASAAAEAPPPAQRQQTLGEVTLEEFLVRAGVVREDMPGPPPPVSPAPVAQAPPPQPQMLFPQSNMFAPMVNPLSLANGLMTGAYGQGGGGGGGAPAMVSPSPTGRPVMSNGYGKMEGLNLSSLSPPPMPYVFSGGLRGRKPPAMEKVVERRQRRMIKNRESAARSRQRKQSYMMELETEVAKLKERNEELQRKQAEILERQKNEVFEKVSRQAGPTSKRICLRRTLTGPW
ncbi:bZIP transcription factor 23 isoform X1 [Aegilops tauschii subsp. strangulata]|uniref:BZIP domain-containing protein n=3 Tax=Aegilops tauschii subsp. strangulata TaxID=200361 RepID=A0A453PR23_AEGTS|nr:bZIP transcription factor 23 isoform X1 [Aegilops tauschii subsp. strangulata]